MRLGLAAMAVVIAPLVTPPAAAQPEYRSAAKLKIDCVPTALLSGEDSLVSELRDELSSLGVASTSAGSCPAVHVSLEKSERGYLVSLREPSARTAHRTLSDLRIAASWIDSWIREDLGAPLLAVRAVAPEFHASTSPGTMLSEPAASIEEVREPRSSSVHLQGALLYESATASDSPDWQALRLDLCARWSMVCLGGILRIAGTKNDELSADSLSRFSRSGADILGQLRLPLRIGQGIVSPHLAIGAGVLRNERIDPADCIDPEGQNCMPQPPSSYPRTRVSLAPRLETGVSLSIPIRGAFYLQVGASMDLRPLGASREKAEDAAPPDPTICDDPNDPNCMDWPSVPPPGSGLIVMPADPDFFWRLAIGLRVQL